MKTMSKPNLNVPSRAEIKIGQRVWAVEKKNYQTGSLTEGVVKRILTKKPYHPRGIKVMFEDGTVGRVQRLNPLKREVPVVDIDKEGELR